MNGTKISHSGLLARSPEGHAARGMQIKGNEDLWVEIQANTFRNWVNECLPAGQRVTDLSTDLCDGVKLCMLVETLQGRPMRPSYNKRPANQHHYLENVTSALNAIENDGVKLVNIGNVDIVNGNLKLILGLIWSLIVRYQIGRSKFPPRKLMLAWLQAVLPECRVHNLTTDWNSGVLLSALVDYCKPGLFPHWRELNKQNSIENCRQAMSIAQTELGIPAVLEPEYLASPWLDELSGMTYLSYFMKPGSPGFHATLRWVNSRLTRSVSNFTSDWNDGRVICELIRSLGGSAPQPEKLRTEQSYWEENHSKAIAAGQKLGVQPVFSAKDMADKNVEHLGVMAYAAHFQWIPERPPLQDLIRVHLESTSGRVGEPTHFSVELLDRNLSYSKLQTEIRSPDNRLHPVTLHRGNGTFTPSRIGMHEIVLTYSGDTVATSYYFRVLPPLVQVQPPGMAPCALGSLVQVLVNATGAPRTEDILVTAYSPHNRPLECPLQTIDGTNSATFKPDEAGEWRIEITYQGKHIQGGPFTCQVFDPRGVHVIGLEGAMPLVPHVLEADTRAAGVSGELFADVVHDKRSVHVRVERVDHHRYKLHFTPKQNGKHRVYVYFNGQDVKGSPFMMRVGTQRGKKSSSNSPNTTYRQSPTQYNSSSLYPNTSSPTYRKSPSPLFGDRRQTTDTLNVSNSSSYRQQTPSPSFNERKQTTNESYTSKYLNTSNSMSDNTKYRNTTSSPLLSDAYNYRQASSPLFGTERKETVTSETTRINEQRYLSSPSYFDRNNTRSPDYKYSNTSSPENVTYNTNKLSQIKLAESSRSPIFMDRTDSPVETSYSTKKFSENRSYNSFEKNTSSVDTSSIVKVSSNIDRNSALRNDSWDAIAKTSNLLSQRSLESIANLTDKQLDSDLHRNSETHNSSYVSRTDHRYNQNEKKVYQSGLMSSSKLVSDTAISGGASSVLVQPVPDGVIGQPVEFEIDGSNAGSGDLEILVEGGRVTSSVRSLGGQRFKAAFTPHQALPHRVDIRFNGQTVPGSPWHVNIMPTSSGLSAPLSVMGDSTRLVPANAPAVFEIITSSSILPSELAVHVVAPSKRVVPARVLPGARSGVQSVEFVPTEVGTHIVEVAIDGEKLPAGPLIAKVYDAGLIQVADVSGGVVGQPVQFKVDASQAGEGQLEISINEGEVPNHVQVVGGGRCLVSFTPDQAKPHLIDIKFNGETVRGCPFVCSVADTSRVTLNLGHLELIPVNQPSSFHMGVAGGGAAELAVAVRGPSSELPVKVTGDIHAGFTAEFMPSQVGPHQITVDYNGHPVQGTPFIAKAFDASRVTVGTVSQGTVGRPVTFSVDASEAGEGNLEITISARGLNIPTQVHPQGNARFAVSFVPAEACDHVVNVAFNKRPVERCPIIVSVNGGVGGPSVTLPGPGPVHRPATLLINHPGRLEDIEVNVEGPGGQAVPTQVQPISGGAGGFRAEFVPRVVGEHRISVSVDGQPASGSPYAAKVYDVNAIKVKEASTGVVGKPVTFLVETSQAGPGNLEVTVNGGRVPTSAQAQGPHTYAISFTPRDASPHSVELRFNGQDVPGSPFTCTVAPLARLLATEALDKVSVGRACTFSVESPAPPVVEILGPARRPLTAVVTPQSKGDCKYDISFTPVDVGDHSVEVRYPSNHIEGSPFLVKAYDASRVSVTDITDGIVGKPVSFSINASQAGAGNLEIIVAVSGRNVPNFVQSEGNARFKVNFKPTEAATHSLSVRFNGQAVPGSPFSCKVSAGNTQPRVPVSGPGVELAALGAPAEIRLGSVAGLDPQIVVTSPTGSVINTKTYVEGDAVVARFTPEMVGRHSVAVLVSDQHIIGSPFSCNVYDVTKVVVTGLPGKNGDGLIKNMSDLTFKEKQSFAEVGKPVTFSVDAAHAGEGTLELVVSTQHSTVKAEVVACARGLYDVTFVPQTNEDHYVNITFNDAPVPGSPFECPVAEATQYVQTGSIAKIDILSENNRIEVIDSNNQKVKYTIKDSQAEFPVSHIGTYRVHIYRGLEMLTTRTIHVFDSSKIEVVSAPEAVCHRPAVVGINLNNTGPGKLTASVKCGNKDIPHSVRQNPNNPKLWEVVFHPERAAPHRLTLMFNNVPKAGVLEIPVRAPGTEPWAGGLGLYQARVGKVTAFTIDTLGRPAREFDVVVSGPTGSALPVRCYQTRTGRLQAEWTALQPGPHRVEVLHQARPLPSSPFTCEAFSHDKVVLAEAPRQQVAVSEKVIIRVSTRDAGSAELEASVTNALGQLVPVSVTSIDDSTIQVSFNTTTPGVYNVALLYGGIALPDSPLSVVAGPMPPQPPPRAVGAGLEAAQVGEMTSFTVISAMQPRVQIEAVEGTIATQMKTPKLGEYIISYTPLWVGTYDVIISCGGQTLAGCPFRPTIVDPTAVRAIGGWQQYVDEHGRLKLPCKIALDVANAGPGNIECIIGGRKVPVDTNGNRVRLNLSAEGFSSGEHSFILTYGNIRLTETPQTAVTSGDQVVLTGRGLAQAQCGETATFTIDGSQAGPGSPEVTLHSADTSLPVPVSLTASSSGEKTWRAQYTVTSPGTYMLSVLWAGRPVKGCPLMVEAKGGADASKVLCSGEGLRHGVVGREIRSWIDTRRAGPGELTAHCSGPRKVAYCELYDHGDATFTLNVKPQEAGRHALTIKYASQHVPGSPFVLRVAGAPDASKVRVYGPGIEHGVLATFQSRFICDTRGAGAGQLTVRVRGPKGAFRVEMQRESQKDRTILCKYDPTEPGDYRVEVKWAGELVPGSPFPVMIFDTQEELRRYLNAL